MKIIRFISLLLFHIYFSALEDFDYIYVATQALSRYSKNIIGVQGKTNKTKCYAKKDIKINETLFKYNKDDILSSETCYHPKKEEVLKNISLFTNDTYERNTFLLSFCAYYFALLDDNNTDVPRNQIFHLMTLPIENARNTEIFFDFPDLNEFLLAGTNYTIFESETIGHIIEKNLNTKDRNNENYKLYSQIYYYIRYHSFNISGHAVILPFMEICNIAPYYLAKPDVNLSNSSIIEEEDNAIVVKATKNFMQTEQYAFTYSNPLDNDLLMLKQGIFTHDNLQDKYIINKKFSYEHNYESDELYHNLKRHNLHPSIFQYKRENLGYDAWFKFELLANNTNALLYRFGLIYFNWWKIHSHDENKEFRHIAKQSLTLILRMCYDELKEIKNRMEVDFDEYLLKTQNYNNLTETNKLLREFTMEKIHLLNKNIKYLYKDLALLNYNEIKQKKDEYIMVENNNKS